MEIVHINFMKNVMEKVITLVKTDKGFRFGGYTSTSWNSIASCQKDSTAFLFSLNKKQKYNIKNENYIIYGKNTNGLIFGSNEIYIRNNCKKKVKYVLILIIIIFLLLINKLIYKLYLYKYSYKKCQSLK